MSLYNDLTTVLTPYANKIKQNESDIGDIQDTLEHLNVETDKTLSIDGKPADAKVVGDEIADLKSGFSGMTTATEKDVGKALKAKTVADGKVTEWEFGSVEVDTSLTKSGVPADASATGDAISKLNSYDVVTENEDITNSLIYGYYYRGTNVALGEKVNLQQVNNVNYSCGTIPVKRDDIYIITGRTRWDDTRVYCFVNNDYVLLEGAELKSELILVEEVVEAPSDGFLVINVRHGDAPKIQKRTVVSEKTLAEKIGELESETLAIESKKVSYPIDGEEIILPSKKSGLLINPDGSVEYGTAESATTDNGENMVKIPNIVVDPMFTDLSNTDAISIENAVCESDGDGVLRYRVTNATHSISIKVADSEETDVIYYSVRVAPKNNYVLVNALGKSVNIQSESETVVGGIASGGVNKTIVISYGSRATMTNTVTMPIVVNLTKVFGAGHEPSYIEFTSIIESWGRDKFGTWISKQKYDYISGTPKLYAKNYFYNDSKYYPEYMTDVETTVTGDGASNRIRTIQTTFQNSFSIGDVVYFAVLVKSSGSPASLELCNVEASAPKAIKTVTSPLADTWYRLSAIMTVKSQYIPRYIEAAVLFADSSAQNGQTLTYKCGMCLNLTEVFGGGNEPTDTTVIDTMLTRYTNGWFPFKKSRDIWNPSIIKWLCENGFSNIDIDFEEDFSYAYDDKVNCINIGIVNISNTAYNNACITGSTFDLYNASGRATFTINNINGVDSTSTTNGYCAISYRGVENPYGGIWRFINNVKIEDSYLVIDDVNTLYKLSNVDGWIDAMGYYKNIDWAYLPISTGNNANSNLPVGDYVFCSNNSYLLIGGSYAAERNAGPFYYHYNSNTNDTHFYNDSARIMYKPIANSAIETNSYNLWKNS